jgi:hypothetical protein
VARKSNPNPPDAGFFLPAQNEYPKPIENIFYLSRLVKIEPCYNFHYLYLSKQQAV